MDLFISCPATIPLSQSVLGHWWRPEGEWELRTPPPPLCAFLLFRALVLHTLIGRQQGFRVQLSISVSVLEQLCDKTQLSHEQVGQFVSVGMTGTQGDPPGERSVHEGQRLKHHRAH